MFTLCHPLLPLDTALQFTIVRLINLLVRTLKQMHGSQTIVDGTLYPYCSLSLAIVKSHTDGKKCIFDQGFLSLQHSHFNCDWKPTTNYHLNCTFLYLVFSLLPLLLVVFLLASLFPFEPNQALFLVILSKEL